MSTKSHWEKIYSEKSPQEVSWTQEIPETSIEFFNEFKLSKTSPIIDIGGGESKFVDFLLAEGYQNISVLDISENALKRAKDRLGEKSKNIEWIVCDINDFNPKKKYALWHDRAVFHFLTSNVEINRYVENVKQNSENFIVGTFSTSGPKKCSGLEISQYDKNLLSKLFEESMTINKVEYINHITPFETTQNFIFCSFSAK
ncbi:MAG: SAM-dependent methyltransferase [Flavobacteriaceae bacterium]|mgnify:FL=1|jgi:SAM-dependent methyltransferase|nr:SAM-dependent methyltransferase [Flavobacteriaceae bacterium]MBT4324969.1 class I SAM-dependent methyltransferase [Cryomorphaceae bacterium]MBT7740052.1 class I SAM-dependent methyltransferase [Cryomorphaceae bacterium]MDC1010360.1 class I SAM-dependent methyltransferase [Flavobacteriaceae bacterium]MDC3297387.1 class I SAM-dependent methyltransferase [Flavobacteriaceae bacterium]|tara:strand:- start:6307 stop:6909 length:603 start_codon:yes stop_codon:yes gene_type:complete